MANITSEITVRVNLRPSLTMWDALILRLAGREVRDAFVRILDAASDNMRRNGGRLTADKSLDLWQVLMRVAPKARFSALDEALMAQGYCIDMRAKPAATPVNNSPEKGDRANEATALSELRSPITSAGPETPQPEGRE